MSIPHFKRRLPGWLGIGLMTLITGLWTFWSWGEMYYEGWWGGIGNKLVYLTFGTVCWLLLLLSVWKPRIGGWVLIVVGVFFSLWWWGEDLIEGTFTLQKMLGQVPLSAGIALVGVLVLREWRWQQQREALGWQPSQRWYLRNLHWLLAVGVPVAVIIGTSVYNLPIVLTRVDDGNRDAVLIEGNNVELIWAPEGPGWNWKQPWGGYPSWASIALYGLEPVGIDSKSTRFYFTRQEDMDRTGMCRYLSEDGLTLMEEPQDIWRMPTVDELVRSMALHGENCGCVWQGEINEQVICSECKRMPDKETPLWNPDLAPIYYWAWNEFDADNAYFVSYNGWVKRQPKSWGNPRHGYRCVKEP